MHRSSSQPAAMVPYAALHQQAHYTLMGFMYVKNVHTSYDFGIVCPSAVSHSADN